MQQNQSNAGFRVLARDIADVSAKEVDQVSGGACTTETKVTWSQEKGADAEASIKCTL